MSMAAGPPPAKVPVVQESCPGIMTSAGVMTSPAEQLDTSSTGTIVVLDVDLPVCAQRAVEL